MVNARAPAIGRHTTIQLHRATKVTEASFNPRKMKNARKAKMMVTAKDRPQYFHGSALHTEAAAARVLPKAVLESQSKNLRNPFRSWSQQMPWQVGQKRAKHLLM